MMISISKNKILVLSVFLLTSVLVYLFFFHGKGETEQAAIKKEPMEIENSSVENIPLTGGDKRSTQFDKNNNLTKDPKTELNNPSIEGSNLEPILARELDFSRPLINQFESLKKSADEGDIDTAFRLGELLQTCAFEPKTQDEYDQRITDQLLTPIESIDFGFTFCKGIKKEQLKLSTFYLEKAAKAGDIEAQLSFFRAFPLEIEGYGDNYKPESKTEAKYIDDLNDRRTRYLESAVAAGNIDAANQLSLSYSNDLAPTITGYDISKAIKYATLGSLMDDRNNSQSEAFLNFLLTQASVDVGEQATRSTKDTFSRDFQSRNFSCIQN